MTPALLSVIQTHARVSDPQECCGVLVKGEDNHATYIPCRNLSQAGQFAIHPEDWARIEDNEIILGVAHSHPLGAARPSLADRQMQARMRVPWWIVTPEGAWARFGMAPLEGRVFAWGVQDCYTLAQDALGGINDRLREHHFWLYSDPFSEGYPEEGFHEVEGVPQAGDVLLFSIRGQGRINHCGIYQGGGRMLHHLPGRLSVIEPVGAWVKVLMKTVRRDA